jgi:isoaspartyl peptidase/L-asparaginase-like protein (Ntn-hydrolase superfamily)
LQQQHFNPHLGGMPGKLKGRVGDAPLIGCGGYANKTGAATVTGVGESIMQMTLGREVVYYMENGQNAQVNLNSITGA